MIRRLFGSVDRVSKTLPDRVLPDEPAAPHDKADASEDITRSQASDSVGAGAMSLAKRLCHQVWSGPTNQVAGWIIDPERPFDALGVRVVLEQRWGLPPIDVAVLTANRPSHLERIQGIDIACGFECRLPVQADASRIHVYEVTTNLELHGSPMHFGVLPRFEGLLDGIIDGQVAGWAW